jgi:hypothetical protein
MYGFIPVQPNTVITLFPVHLKQKLAAKAPHINALTLELLI